MTNKTKFTNGSSTCGSNAATEATMTMRMVCALCAMVTVTIAGCFDPETTGQMPDESDGGIVPAADGGIVVVPTCEEQAATRDADGDGFCPAGHDLDADGTCCDTGESLPPDQGDCNDDARTISPASHEICGNLTDEDCGESPCSTSSACPDPDAIDPDCGATPACAAGLTRNCTTSCGSTTGVQACSASGTWDTCAALPGEICGNGQDDNCSGGVDEGCSSSATCVTGLVNDCTTSCGSRGTQTCSASGTWGVCNAPTGEICGNLRDDNCDGRIDEGCSSSTDCTRGASIACPTSCGSSGSQVCAADGHSYGACMPPSESCNGRDDDCDGIIDDGCAVAPVCTAGVSQPCSTSCGSTGNQICALDGHSWGVCIAPTESCNGRDDDCDGLTDEGCARFYRDVDGDGFGRATDTVTAMSAPAGYVAIDSDCDDARADVNPGRAEVCANGIDDNCSGGIDEGCAVVNYYRDADGDGYGRNDLFVTMPTAGYTVISGDCNDSNAEVHPGHAEICGNGLDDDCNGGELPCASSATYYRDSDGDGYGRNDMTQLSSTGAPSGYVATSGDCNDSNASVHPGAADVCPSDGLDNDCSGGDMTACGPSCGSARTVRLTFSATPSSSITISSSSTMRWYVPLQCVTDPTGTTRTSGTSSVDFSVDWAGPRGLRHLNAEITDPVPSGTISSGEAVSRWLCQEPHASDPRTPFGIPTIREPDGRTYVNAGVRGTGATFNPGEIVAGHLTSLGWGCDLWLCEFDSPSACRIP